MTTSPPPPPLPVILAYSAPCSVFPHLSFPTPHPSLWLSQSLSSPALEPTCSDRGVKSSGASKAAVWRLHVMWEPQQPCLQTSQTAAATIDPRPASPPTAATSESSGAARLINSSLKLDATLHKSIWRKKNGWVLITQGQGKRGEITLK